MSLIRPPVVLLALLAQILAGIVPYTMAICVHADGQAMPELWPDLCCREAYDDRRSPDADEASPGPSLRAVTDDCEDEPLHIDQVLRDGPEEPDSYAHAVSPLPVNVGSATGLCVQGVATADSGPPPHPLLVHIRTVRLCC